MATYCREGDGDREPFSCPICFEDYDLVDTRRAPKLLLCLHTFCFECTQKLWKDNGSLECSMCRMLHERVLLEELFDNHVIIQHLRQEREEQDLEFARKIDQELRNEFRPDLESTTICEEQSDMADETDNIDNLEVDAPSVIVLDEDNDSSIINADNVPVENERNDCQWLNILGDLDPSSDSDNDEEDNNIEGDGSDEDVLCDDQTNGDGQDDSSDNDGNEEPEFSFTPFSQIIQQDKEEDVHNEESDSEDEGDTNEEVFENPALVIESFPCPFGVDNEDEDDDDDDDRFHSACDEISSSLWVDHELQVHDGSEDDDEEEDSSSFCWHILSPESLLDD